MSIKVEKKFMSEINNGWGSLNSAIQKKLYTKGKEN